MQENIIQEWQQNAASEKRLEGPSTPERAGDQERTHDLAWLIAEELRRKDAHIARLEALLQQQTTAEPMEHEPRPESFAPDAHDPQSVANPLSAMPLSPHSAGPLLRSGAMVYDTPSAALVTEAVPLVTPLAQTATPILSMVYDAPPTLPEPARIRLADMQIEHSPVAQTVMQARVQRLTEPVPALDPTLRLEAPDGRRNHAPLLLADNGRAKRNRMAAVLASVAFAGTIGVLQMRGGRQEPTASTLSAASATSAPAGKKYLLNAPAAINTPLVVNAQARPLEILPDEPAPKATKRPAQRAHVVHIASAPVVHRANPLPYVAPAHHAAPSRLSAVTPPIHHRSSVAQIEPTQPTGPRVEPSDKPVHNHQTPSRPHAAVADTMTASAEVLPDNSPDTTEDNSASLPRISHRRHYRRYAAEADERRSRVYKYGENARRPFDYDAEFARHPAPGYDEKTDAWIDKLPQ